MSVEENKEGYTTVLCFVFTFSFCELSILHTVCTFIQFVLINSLFILVNIIETNNTVIKFVYSIPAVFVDEFNVILQSCFSVFHLLFCVSFSPNLKSYHRQCLLRNSYLFVYFFIESHLPFYTPLVIQKMVCYLLYVTGLLAAILLVMKRCQYFC